jgi:hypothetical protein|nr:MAG TPA: hypothetical protein [Caudoviricetes sp.]
MKVSTIEEIHKVLKSQAEATNAIYLNFREELRERYSTIWLDSVVSDEEAKELEKRKKESYKASDLLEEFEQNEW